jgi:hypothetical protein
MTKLATQQPEPAAAGRGGRRAFVALVALDVALPSPSSPGCAWPG